MIRRVLWAVIAAGLTVILANAVVLARLHDAAHDPLRRCATAADRICVRLSLHGDASYIDSDWQGHELLGSP